MLLAGALASVKAADINVPPAPPDPSGWIVTIGGDGRAVPLYMGSDAWGAVPRPYFDWRRPGSPESFHGARDGTGIALFDNGVVAVGPVGLLTWPRKEAYSSFLNGFGNVGFTAQVGGFMDYWAGLGSVRASRGWKVSAALTGWPQMSPWMPSFRFLLP
jgi:outer membrane protein